MSISKEQFEQSFKDKSYFELEDLVHLIEDNFGYNVTLKKKDSSELTDEQKKKWHQQYLKTKKYFINFVKHKGILKLEFLPIVIAKKNLLDVTLHILGH